MWHWTFCMLLSIFHFCADLKRRPFVVNSFHHAAPELYRKHEPLRQGPQADFLHDRWAPVGASCFSAEVAQMPQSRSISAGSTVASAPVSANRPLI